MAVDGYGEFRTTQLHENGTVRLFIDRADPRVLISAAIVDAARAGDSPFLTLDDDLLRITAENRTVLYRLGEKSVSSLAYVAEWPD